MTEYTDTDETIFVLTAQAAIETPGNIVNIDSIIEHTEVEHIRTETVRRSLKFLAERGLLVLGGRDSYAQLSESGIERWARANLDYQALERELGRAIVAANGRTTSRQLASQVAALDLAVRHVIRIWGLRNQLTVGRTLIAAGEVLPVTGTTETFRRLYSV